MKIQVERIITNSQIQFKTSMLKFGPCDYIDVYIPLKGTLNVVGQRADKQQQQQIEKIKN